MRLLAHRLYRVARASSDDVLNLLMKPNRRVAVNVEGEKRSRNTDRARERESPRAGFTAKVDPLTRRVEVDFNAREAMSNRNAFSVGIEFSITKRSFGEANF